MLVRFVQVAIVLFWATMTVLLVRVVYFPDETRLTEVPASFVMARFLSQRAPSELVVLDRGRELGSLTVSPGRLSEPDPETGAEIEVLLAGSARVFLDPGADAPSLIRYVSRLYLDGASELVDLRFELRVPAADSVVSVRALPQTDEVLYRVVRAGETVLDTGASGDELNEMSAQVKLLMDSLGSGFGLGGVPGVAGLPGVPVPGGVGDGLPERPVPVGRQGLVTVEGQRISAYMLEIPFLAGQEMTFIFTKSGELLKVEGVLGYEMVSTVLRASETPAVFGAPNLPRPGNSP